MATLARYLGIEPFTLGVATAVVSVSPMLVRFLQRLLPILRQAGKASGGKVLIFDVNETMLDLLGGLGPVMEKVVGRQGAYEEFFRQLILMTHVLTITGGYKNFAELAPTAFAQVVANAGVTGAKAEVDASGWEKVKAAMGQLEAHPDVAAGLDAMKRQGWQLIAFSNSNQALVSSQLKRAGLLAKFDAVLSVESVRAFKPKASCYHFALKQAGVGAEEAIMVATHDW